MSEPTCRLYDITSLPDPSFYSHGTSFDGASRFVVTSGQLGQRADGSFPESHREEIQQAMANLAKVVEAGGADMRNIIKLTFYCVDWDIEKAGDLMEPVTQSFQTSYGITARPATTLVPVTKLAIPGARFEVEGLIVAGGKSEVWVDGSSTAYKDQPDDQAKVDVVVVGGGFSGLQAAYDVHKAGLSCLVLEAKGRIGGRSHSKELANGRGIIELGATWINQTTQPKIYSLTQKFGLDCVPQPETGASMWQSADGSTWRVEEGDLPMPPAGEQSMATDLEAILRALEEEQLKIDIRAPEATDANLDMTVEEWLQKNNFGEWAEQLMRFFIGAIVGREAREVGLFYAVDYIKSGGGFDSLRSVGKDGAQSLRVKQGTSAIASGLARELPPKSILTHSPVREIIQRDSDCIVSTQSGFKIRCSRVIVATPTNTYTDISFVPPLPSEKRALANRTMPGNYTKVILTYNSPWWRKLGLSGSFNSTKGPTTFTWENSDDITGKHYSLAAFIYGDSAAEWHQLTSLDREEALLSHLVQLVGQEHEKDITDLVEINYKQWTKEEWIRGAPTGSLGPGDLSRYGKTLRASAGRVHFGSGDTAFEWKGYLEGALRAGSRVAEEVVKLVNEESNS